MRGTVRASCRAENSRAPRGKLIPAPPVRVFLHARRVVSSSTTAAEHLASCAMQKRLFGWLGAVTVGIGSIAACDTIVLNDGGGTGGAGWNQANSTIELRPEAGSEFLQDNDAALCPRGPRGTVFSFARLLDRTNTTNDSGDDEAVRSALRKLALREPPGSLLSVRTLRTMQQLPAPRFDAAVLRLSRAGKVILHHHDFPTSLAGSKIASRSGCSGKSGSGGTVLRGRPRTPESRDVRLRPNTMGSQAISSSSSASLDHQIRSGRSPFTGDSSNRRMPSESESKSRWSKWAFVSSRKDCRYSA